VRKRVKVKASSLLLLVFTLALLPAGLTQAKKPLIGTMDLEFNLAWFEVGPQEGVPDWVGTINIDGEQYGMLFFAIGSGKPFTADPPGGSVHFFEEIWAIYDMGDKVFPEIPTLDGWEYWLPDDTPPDELILCGHDVGITNRINSKYHMNGNVEYAAEGWETYLGRNVHMSGEIIWDEITGFPLEAPGTFRIN
jgi:hypothetical protein